MTKRSSTLTGIAGLMLGIVGGIAGTAFSLGANRQKVNDLISQHSSRIKAIKEDANHYEKATQEKLNRFSERIADQIVKLQSGITDITDIVNQLRIDVQVVKVLMERVENDLRTGSNKN